MPTPDYARIHLPSESTNLQLARPDAPAVTGSIEASATTGSITELIDSAEYQYREVGTTEWTTIAKSTEITNLQLGEYEVRLVATDTAFASRPARVNVDVRKKLAGFYYYYCSHRERAEQTVCYSICRFWKWRVFSENQHNRCMRTWR
ncbi:MAG: hypothetical protein LBP35_01085 [Candidatus Ancillula trichonymphae]|jgi:hypothetical protein|nr:hypothetical protein [Candidatus Ancillula trichonymphae]